MEEKGPRFVISENQFSDDFIDSVKWFLTERDDVILKHLITHPKFEDIEYLKQLVWILREKVKCLAAEQHIELELLAGRSSETVKDLQIINLENLQNEQRKVEFRLHYLENRHVAQKKLDTENKEEIKNLEIEIEDLELELEYVKKEKDDTKAELQRLRDGKGGTLATSGHNPRL
jgi:hypothetical protein